jgi:hypothetical protein
MAKFSVMNSDVPGPPHLMETKSTLKDESGKTAYPNPDSRKGYRYPDVALPAENGAVGTVEVKTPFGSQPVDPVEYLRTHPKARNQMNNEAEIMKQGNINWGPEENMCPVVPGEGPGIATGAWHWKPRTGYLQ